MASKWGIPDIDKNGDEREAQQHELRLVINHPSFSLGSGVSGLSKGPSAADRLVKDEADKQFRGAGHELRSSLR